MITLNKNHFPNCVLCYSPGWVSNNKWAIRREFVTNSFWVDNVVGHKENAEYFRGIRSLKDSDFLGIITLNDLKTYQRTEWFRHDEYRYVKDSVGKGSKRKCCVYMNDDDEYLLFDSLYLKMVNGHIDVLLHPGLDENKMLGFPAINVAERKQDVWFLIMPINSLGMALPSVLFNQLEKRKFW